MMATDLPTSMLAHEQKKKKLHLIVRYNKQTSLLTSVLLEYFGAFIDDWTLNSFKM